jgi:hypothetical protein
MDDNQGPTKASVDDAQNIALLDVMNELNLQKQQVQHLQACLDRITSANSEYMFDSAIRALVDTMAPLGQIVPQRGKLDKEDATRLRLLLQRLDRLDYAAIGELPIPGQHNHHYPYKSESAA